MEYGFSKVAQRKITRPIGVLSNYFIVIGVRDMAGH